MEKIEDNYLDKFSKTFFLDPSDVPTYLRPIYGSVDKPKAKSQSNLNPKKGKRNWSY